ncbi:hypothetical protein PIB30_044384 [Stylosanthes scabra]|uniref:Uncharacterized protein n=1 Tax=Stylosanthes scabra TaxID=79078 RepID=A0ABU6WH05_9FABA|nr:hypothetical protein [Stylosanthes scabra]
MKSVKFRVEELLRINTTRVLLYQGQYDLAAGPVQVEAWVKTMKWEGIEDYLNAERKIWKVNGELAGYVQQWKSLTNVVVLGGGHLMPADQPLSVQAMIQDWVLQRAPFSLITFSIRTNMPTLLESEAMKKVQAELDNTIHLGGCIGIQARKVPKKG